MNLSATIYLKQAPSGVFVLMSKYEKTAEGAMSKKQFDSQFLLILDKLSRDATSVKGVSLENEHEYDWDSWIFDSKEHLQTCLNYIRCVPSGLVITFQLSMDLKDKFNI